MLDGSCADIGMAAAAVDDAVDDVGGTLGSGILLVDAVDAVDVDVVDALLSSEIVVAEAA
eukprot:CAMPEP_0119558248 /NCGR_PEP_ID=MMETSP1352-20130426/10430_1 /TAXON_ID=265584 /ORGANISM="Stauroneis constricta, Strain CCMP1120" /LENGTH=59 /DNA_ID=CAMNT_0007605543 /DNA_START=29 /DNA_END=204 /DNA_ORIENTATION=-